MSFLKGTVIFLAGAFTMAYLVVDRIKEAEEYPYKEKILFENDDMRIVRIGNNLKSNLAAVTYKEKTENSEETE